MNTFYIDLLSIFFLFLTSLTCFFALFGKKGLYWVLPWIAASILTFLRVLEFRAPEASFVQLSGSDLYIEMLTPVALLTLFLSSLLLRFGIRRAHLFYASQIERQQSVPKVPAVPAVPLQLNELLRFLRLRVLFSSGMPLQQERSTASSPA